MRNCLPARIFIAAAVLLPTVAWSHAPSELAQQRMLEGGLVDVAWLGAEHMLTGYDHLLFLLGVLFFLSRPLQIVGFITAFTLGHTLVLLTATPAGIGADPYLVDAFIALTVIYKAFENLDGFPRLLGVRAPPQLPMVFGFGLIHGFGLSTRLQAMTVAADPQLHGKILAFNVGVELGQLAALGLMGVALFAWRRAPGWALFSRLTNSALMAAGVLLLVVQLRAYLTQSPATDIPLATPATTGPHLITRSTS